MNTKYHVNATLVTGTSWHFAYPVHDWERVTAEFTLTPKEHTLGLYKQRQQKQQQQSKQKEKEYISPKSTIDRNNNYRRLRVFL